MRQESGEVLGSPHHAAPCALGSSYRIGSRAHASGSRCCCNRPRQLAHCAPTPAPDTRSHLGAQSLQCRQRPLLHSQWRNTRQHAAVSLVLPAGNPMRPHRARLVYSLVNSYGLCKQMSLFRPQPRSFDQLTEFHADGERFEEFEGGTAAAMLFRARLHHIC